MNKMKWVTQSTGKFKSALSRILTGLDLILSIKIVHSMF